MSRTNTVALLRLTGFLGAAWCGSKVSKLIGISSIVLELTVGMVLGPNVLGFVPKEYSVCRAKASINCEAPPDLLSRLREDDIIHQGLGTIYKQGLCPKEHYSFQFGHDGEHPNEILMNASGVEGTEFAGHRRLSGGGRYSTIEDCLVKSCKQMVSRECLLQPSFLTIIGQAGVALMIFESGMRFDFGRAGKVAPKACVVAIFAAGLPMITGALLMLAFGKPFVPDGLAVGVSLSPTSIGCSIKLLTEVGALQEDFGQATICAAFMVDIIAMILLNILFSLHGDFDVMATVVKPIIGITFMALAMWAAVRVWPRVIDDWILPRVPETISKPKRTDKEKESKAKPTEEVLFFIMFCVLIAYATITYFLGTHLWGCFTAGMSFTCLSKKRNAHAIWVRQTKRVLKWMIRIFFSSAIAFSIPINKLLSVEAFWKGTLLGLGPCIAGKFFCAPNMGDARFIIGSAMVCRAEFAYLIAQMALSADLIDSDTFSIVIWSLLYATMFAPLLFRKLLSRYMARRRAAARDVGGGAENVSADALVAPEVKAIADVNIDGCSAARDARGGPVVAGEATMEDANGDGRVCLV